MKPGNAVRKRGGMVRGGAKLCKAQGNRLKNESQASFSHPLILFDGVCNLCERSVRFIIRRDERALFRFASLQSATARRLLTDSNHQEPGLSSVLLVIDGRIYNKSRAALEICRRLDGAWPAVYYLFFWLPARVADTVYDFVGNRRYRWFGQKNSCWMPDEDLRRRFIDS